MRAARWSERRVFCGGLGRQTASSVFLGTSTPPGIGAAVPSIAAPLGVNGFSALPPQSNGPPTSEPIYTNGIHPYPGEPTPLPLSRRRNSWELNL